MSKAKFQAARELIEEHDYDGARMILQTIDHTKAREWEVWLDQIDPAIDFPLEKAKRKPNSLAHKIYRRTALFIIGSFIFLVVLALLISTEENAPLRAEPSRPIGTPYIDIDNTRNIELQERYLTSLNSVLFGRGDIQSFESLVNSDGRLVVYQQVHLGKITNADQAHDFAVETLELALRDFAKLSSEVTGRFSMQIFWENKDGTLCGVGAGMGYATMSEINWRNIHSNQLWDILNQRYFADMPGEYYGQTAFTNLDRRLDVGC